MRAYYEADGVTIYHGDCRTLQPFVDVDLVLADPPYGETSLGWDRWPGGWLLNLGAVRSLWCFGSLRLFMERAGEFHVGGWQLSQDVIWEKQNGSSFHADRFKRVHESVAHFYRGEWSEV